MSSVTLVSISTLTNMVAAQSLTCQVLQSNLLDCMLMTQTRKEEQYCCHVGDSIGSIITWLVSCFHRASRQLVRL